LPTYEERPLLSDLMKRLSTALSGRYEIARQIGEGGMATVYLAEDLKHHRQVALKVLKPELAAIVGAERFLAEIETTAGLQHPNILPLHDSGEADGSVFYVMPYVEEETLRQRLDREKQLPVDEAVRITREVAEALDYAHRKGVIHRDIKPGNILLRDGRPLVADFGIALAASRSGGGKRLTETGLSLGTPYYMSPEQATGSQEVGPATDIYALGCVLYEMLVGEPPHTGSTPQAILGKIITGEAKSVSAQRRSVPVNVDGAVAKAIQRLPADRFSSAKEFARALADPGFRHGESGAAATAGVGPWKAWAVGSSLLALVFALVAAWALLRPGAPEAPFRYELGRGDPTAFAVSPDGRTVVYVGVDGLYRQDLGQLDPTPIPGTEGAFDPFFSPDGAWVGYFQGTAGELKKTHLQDDATQTLAVVPGQNQWAAWAPDHTIIAHTSNAAGALWRVPDTGGEWEGIVESDGQELVGLDLLPDGQAVLTSREGEVVVIELDTGERRPLGFQGASPRYEPSGHVVFWRDEALWAVPFDAERLVSSGPPTQIAQGVSATDGVVAHFAVGGDVLLYREGPSQPGGVPTWLGRDGTREVLDPELRGRLYDPAVSPDGTKVAFGYIDDELPGQQIRVYDRDQRTLAVVTPGRQGAFDVMPFWHPDSREVGFLSNRSGRFAVYARPWDQSETTRLLLEEPDADMFDVGWTPDGRSLVYFRSGGDGVDLMYSAPHPDSTPHLIVEGGWNRSLSPNGRCLAYVSGQSGQNEVYLGPFPGPGGRQQVSTDGGLNPVWAHNGRELFYLAGEPPGVFTVATVRTEGECTVGSREPLFSWNPYFFPTNPHPQWDLSLDDQRILAIENAPPGEEADARYVVVLNFSELLRQVGPE